MQTDVREAKDDTSCRVLNPVTSSNTSRYRNQGNAQLCSQIISRGPTLRTTRIPYASDWQCYVHPEGQPYFVLIGKFGFAVVTEANIRDAHIQGRILQCLSVANKEIKAHDIPLPSRCELFLELGDDEVSCNYYFVDHIGKSLFWLDRLGSEFLALPAAVSSSHLETALEQLYWVHVEYFPMHHESHEQEFSQIVDDLYNIISHGQADRLTSRTSTFPYTADTCKQFLKLLSRKKGQRVDGYTLCYAARLAGAIMNQRFVTFHGQQPAQLDRLQEMFPAGRLEHKWLSTLANLSMWGIPQQYATLLEELFVNEQVYADQWSRFVSNSLADWTTTLSWSFPVLIASLLLANVRGSSVSMSIPSVLSSAISIASASCLHLRHQPLADSSAAVGARYLHSAKSGSVGFLCSSVAFSLPRASYLWAIGFLTVQFLYVAFHSVNKMVALIAACIVAAILICLLYIINPEDSGMMSSVRSLVSYCMPNMYGSEAREDESMV